jgi:hypothetical protein
MTDRFPPGSVEINPASLVPDQNAEPSSFIDEQVLPLYSEELSVSRRQVERGVRVLSMAGRIRVYPARDA